MTSLFEQYEELTASTRKNTSENRSSGGGHGRSPSDRMISPVSRNIMDRPGAAEQPIFAKERIEFQIPSGKSIYRMAVCNRLIIIATKDNTIFRLDIGNNPDQMETLDARTSSAGDTVEDIFVDPMGRHIILAMRSGECLYFSRTSKKARPMPKLRNHILSAVGWNPLALEGTSGTPMPILLGTSQGLIFETEFNANAAEGSTVTFLAANVENYWKQVCNLAQPEPQDIKGIVFDRIRTGRNNLYVVIIATKTRLFQFRGQLGQASEPPYFQEIFQLDPEKPMTNFQELPGNPRHCCLSAWRPIPSSQQALSLPSIAWLNEPGVYYADIGLSGEDDVHSGSSFLLNPQIYFFPKDSSRDSKEKDKEKSTRAISLVCTEFHILIQYTNFVKVLSKLSCQSIMDDQFSDRYGKLMGICRDPAVGTVWVYSDQAVYRYKIQNESREVWKIYRDKGDYDSALKFCQNDPSRSNMLQILKAESLLQQGKYESSAEIYAISDAAFEEIALKFSRLKQEKALKILLLKKAESLKSGSGVRSPQLFMICSWLMEIYLNNLAQLKNNEREQAAFNSNLVEFRQFLTNPQFMEIFMTSPDVFYGILLSHGADDEYVYFASQLGDARRLIEFQLERQNYREALLVLASHSGSGAAELTYEFSPQLMRHIPKLVVDLWISKGKNLSPQRLLPSLQRYTGPDDTEHEAGEIIRYLEHCVLVLKMTDSALHNYLVTLYCKIKAERELLEYMLLMDDQSKQSNMEYYDQKAALRLCVENDLREAAIQLYVQLDLHAQAVELALETDVKLAKTIAKSTSLETEVRKYLWLLIAQYVVTKDTDISNATELLHESGDVIKIEDILPFFPDFVTIDDFKDAICASLEDYNRHIGSLKGEVEDATKEAQELRHEILEYRSQCLFINGTEQCFSCKLPLLTNQFFVFPCKHYIHWDCLLNIVRVK